MKWLDDLFERKTRKVAQQSSRRGALIRIGKLMVGTAFVLPVLPFDRTAQAAAGAARKAANAKPGDQDCEYWRYCAQDGYLCSCCGGTASTCPVCKKLLPILRSVNRTEQDWLRVVLTSDGEQPEHLAFYEKADLKEFPYVLSSEPGIAYRVAKLPYAVLLNEHGRVVAKGLVNSREQLESLFTAKEMGVASVQDFIDHQHA